jgi:hypothetical protein
VPSTAAGGAGSRGGAGAPGGPPGRGGPANAGPGSRPGGGPGGTGPGMSGGSTGGGPGSAGPGGGREKPPLPALTEAAMVAYYAEPLPSFRDVPPAEKQLLFVQKLHLCAFPFDFSNPAKHVREKEIKRQTLLELVDYANSGQGKFTEAVSPDIIFMLCQNLFRTLPPSRSHDVDNFDPEEEEPMLEPAWPHLQARGLTGPLAGRARAAAAAAARAARGVARLPPSRGRAGEAPCATGPSARQARPNLHSLPTPRARLNTMVPPLDRVRVPAALHCVQRHGRQGGQKVSRAWGRPAPGA